MARSRAKGRKTPGKDEKGSTQRGGGGTGNASAAADTAAVEDSTSLLSPELMAELGDSSAGGAMVTHNANSKGSKKKKKRVSSETRELAASMSKSKAKKLKQLEDKKLKDGRRAELYLKLEKNKLSQQQLSLLQSSKTISMNQDTLRSRVKQAVQRAVAGIALSEAVVNELESHPAEVADVEEALALPVGGALAAARKSNGSSAATGRRGDSGSGGGGGGGGGGSSPAATVGGREGRKKAAASAVTVGDGKSGRAKAGSGGDAAAEASLLVEKAAPAAVVSSKKRGRCEAVPVAEPKTKKRIEVVPPKAPVGPKPKLGLDDSSAAAASGKKQTAPAPTPAAAAAEAAAAPAATTKTADTMETESEPETLTTTGSTWAEKMMASIARLPTSTSTSQWGARASSSASSVPPRKSKPAVNALDAEEDDGGDEAGSRRNPGAIATDTGNDDVDDDDGSEEKQMGVESSESTAAATPEVAVASYPPPPTWVEGNAPAYHAVETPLPSTSGVPSKNNKNSSNGSATNLPRPERWVPVKRPAALQAARMQLPVCGMEQEITEAIHDNDTIILCGETGSGKSTQVPQFLYEAGYAAHGLIGVTQPRRVAAVGTAERVAVELGTKCGRGGAVAYQIRYDASGVGEKTRVKFMTDGVLLQEITSDLLLRKYSVVLLDEAHERNLNTDVLLGMLSRSIPLR